MKSVFIIAGLFFLISCGNTSKPVIAGKSDTVVVSYAPNGTENWALAKATYTIGKKWAYGDSAHSDGIFKMDTISWRFFILTDTLRNKEGKPMYDSIKKQYMSNWQWIQLTEQQLQSITIHIIPKNK